MVISALLAAYACVLRLTAETCAIVIVAKVAVVFNIIMEALGLITCHINRTFFAKSKPQFNFR